MLAEALAYAAAGWRVFPCKPKGKQPLKGVRWQGAATCDPDQIRAWWRANPDANIGAITGGALGVVMDLDRFAALEELPAEPTTGRIAETGGGGRHYFFRTVADLGNHRGRMPAGIDIRGDGTGYVILPPSVHASGQRYTWLQNGDAAPMPPPLLRLIKDAPAAPQPALGSGNLERARAWLRSRPGSVKNWGGNKGWNGDTYLFETAQHVVQGFDLSAGEALLALQEWNTTCSPPWPLARLEYKIREAMQRGHMQRGAKLAADRPKVHAWQLNAPARPLAVVNTNHGPARAAFAPHVPLFSAGQLPPFPVQALPAWCADYVAALAESTQTPAELGGLLALATCSAALQRKIVVSVKAGWLEPVNLWAVIAMPPSSRKSPVYSQIVKPIETWEAARTAESNQEMARHLADKEIEERRLATLKAQAAKASRGEERTALRYELQDLAERLATMKPPPASRMLLSDVTPEAFVSFLASSNGRAALLADEGGIFDNMAGRYSKGRANADAFLKAYSGTAIRVDRRERAEHVQDPALAMGLTVQPQVLRELAANEALAGRGLLARPLFAVPESNVGRRVSALETRPVPYELAATYREHMADLLDVRLPAEARALLLSPGARAELLEFDRWLESQIAPDGDLAHLAEWCGKLVGTACRVAGVLTVAENLAAVDITADTMARAIALARWAIPHADAAIGTMGAGEGERAAGKVWEAIKRAAGRTGEAETTHRQISQALKRSLDADTVYAAMALLCEHGYLRTSDAKTFEIRPELIS